MASRDLYTSLYTIATFREWQAKRSDTEWGAIEERARLMALAKMPKNSKARAVAKYRVSTLLDELERDFGRDENAIGVERDEIVSVIGLYVNLTRDNYPIVKKLLAAAKAGREITLKKSDLKRLSGLLEEIAHFGDRFNLTDAEGFWKHFNKISEMLRELQAWKKPAAATKGTADQQSGLDGG